MPPEIGLYLLILTRKSPSYTRGGVGTCKLWREAGNILGGKFTAWWIYRATWVHVWLIWRPIKSNFREVELSWSESIGTESFRTELIWQNGIDPTQHAKWQWSLVSHLQMLSKVTPQKVTLKSNPSKVTRGQSNPRRLLLKVTFGGENNPQK